MMSVRNQIQQPRGVDSDNTGSPEEKIGGAFPAPPPLPGDSFQSSERNQFSRLSLSRPLLLPPPRLPPFLPSARIRGNPFRSHDSQIISVLPFIPLPLEEDPQPRMYPPPPQTCDPPGSCGLALFAFPQETAVVLTLVRAFPRGTGDPQRSYQAVRVTAAERMSQTPQSHIQLFSP